MNSMNLMSRSCFEQLNWIVVPGSDNALFGYIYLKWNELKNEFYQVYETWGLAVSCESCQLSGPSNVESQIKKCVTVWSSYISKNWYSTCIKERLERRERERNCFCYF